jgi:hypothetical protein
MKAAKGSLDELLVGCVSDNTGSACATSITSIDDADIAATHTIAPRNRKAAIVLAAVKGKALTRQPDGRPGPPLRAMAMRILAGTQEWPMV